MINWGVVFGACGAVMSVIGFLTLFIKIGISRGQQDAQIMTVEKEVLRHGAEIKTLQDAQGKISVELARFMGRLEADIKYIRESLDEVKRKKGV